MMFIWWTEIILTLSGDLKVNVFYSFLVYRLTTEKRKEWSVSDEKEKLKKYRVSWSRKLFKSIFMIYFVIRLFMTAIRSLFRPYSRLLSDRALLIKIGAITTRYFWIESVIVIFLFLFLYQLFFSRWCRNDKMIINSCDISIFHELSWSSNNEFLVTK